MAMSMMLSSPLSSSSSSYASSLTLGRNNGLRSSQRVTTSIRSSSTSETNGSNGGEGGPNRLDRRNILIGLGGLYGATTLGGTQMAVGAPMTLPDLTACHTANYPDGFGDKAPVECCPPYDLNNLSDVKQYVIPTNLPLRRRKPAHKLSQFEKDRFKTAIREMKALPRNHPWNFMQQAQIHCAYCNEAYYQKNTDRVPLQVHFSWLFLPWHRYYLYFYERILGKIIEDESFALPFWNYDVEDGMKYPDIFKDPSSSLYNPNRNLVHFDQFVNLNYSYDIEDSDPPADVVQQNLDFMWKLFRNSKSVPSLFMGDPVRAGQHPDAEAMSGALENMHNTVHMWTGSVEAPNRDMGNFFSAARDTIFYALHANVDRLWHLYRTLRGNKLEFNDNDWLKATFYFYDENQKVVTVKAEDCLNTSDLGVVYEDVPVKYLTPSAPVAAAPTKPRVPSKLQMVKIGEFGPSPRPLSEPIRVVVNRPKASRTPADKIDKEEILEIDGIEVLDPEAVRFDVYINIVYQDNFVAGLGNFVGSYTKLRHIHTSRDGVPVKTKLELGITSEVEDLGADANKKLAVTLVPRNGQVNIGAVQIKLVKTDY